MTTALWLLVWPAASVLLFVGVPALWQWMDRDRPTGVSVRVVRVKR